MTMTPINFQGYDLCQTGADLRGAKYWVYNLETDECVLYDDNVERFRATIFVQLAKNTIKIQVLEKITFCKCYEQMLSNVLL